MQKGKKKLLKNAYFILGYSFSRTTFLHMHPSNSYNKKQLIFLWKAVVNINFYSRRKSWMYERNEEQRGERWEEKDEGGGEYVRFCPLRENVRRLSCHAEISGVWFGDDWWGRRSKWSAALRAPRLTCLLGADLKVWNTGDSPSFSRVIRLKSLTLFCLPHASFYCFDAEYRHKFKCIGKISMISSDYKIYQYDKKIKYIIYR